jgi:hypothetical protein
MMPLLHAEALLDEMDLVLDLRLGQAIHRAQEIVAEELVPPVAGALGRRRFGCLLGLDRGGKLRAARVERKRKRHP